MTPMPSWPTLSRPSTSSYAARTVVDTRAKLGHDDKGERMLTNARIAA